MNENNKKERNSEQEKIEKVFYEIGWGVLVLTILFIILNGHLGGKLIENLPPCLIHKVTGVYCPGCGGTRAVLAFLHGHFIKSFLYHPIVPYTGFICGWFMISQTIEKISRGRWKVALHFHTAYLWVALAIIVLNVIIKDTALLCFGIDLLKF